MSDETFQKGSVTYVKRREARRPSIKTHARRAFVFSLMAVAAAFVGYKFMGDAGDAIATGTVEIEKAPLPVASDNLGGTGTDLPDLLTGEVPEGANPTELTDALGNPIGAQQNMGLAGSNPQPQPAPVETIASIQPIVPSGPKTIMIDGKPIAGGGFPTAALPRAPLADITRTGPWGSMPTISPSGNKAVTAYARPFTPAAGKSQVAVIIGGLGIDRNLTRRIINELPPEVTLSFAAHTNGLQTWIHQARERGHEVIIEIPMEGFSFNASEPGAGLTLKTDATASTNIRNLDRLLSKAQGYYAVTNYNGGRLIEDQSALLPILQHLTNSGVGFIYDGSNSDGTLSTTAATAGLSYHKAFSVIDAQSDVGFIQANLSTLEAASSGSAQIGVGFALPETFMAVKNWVRTLDMKGMELAPASHVLNR